MSTSTTLTAGVPVLNSANKLTFFRGLNKTFKKLKICLFYVNALGDAEALLKDECV
jgi:hypothetical protein